MSLQQEIAEKMAKLKVTRTKVTYPDGQGHIETRSSALPLERLKKQNGFVVDNKPDDKPAKITDYLYLGSQDCCSEIPLRNRNILNVLSVGVQPSMTFEGIRYNFIECLDLPETNIWNIILEAVQVMRSSVCKSESILVHCNAGVSRSASIVVGYLMLELNFDFDTAYSHVKLCRPCIRPNDGFMKQLREYKKSLS